MSTIPEVDIIDEQIAALQAQKKELLDAKRIDALKEALKLVRTFGFTAQELELVAPAKASTASTGTKSKAVAKYQNPTNTAETWHGGKGPRPKWVKAYVAQGGNIEECLIKK